MKRSGSDQLKCGNAVTIPNKAHDTNVTIHAKSKRMQTSASIKKQCVPVQIIGPNDTDIEKKRKLVNRDQSKLMPALKRFTSESPLLEPCIRQHMDDNPSSLHNDLAMRRSYCDGRVRDTVKKFPSNIVIRPARRIRNLKGSPRRNHTMESSPVPEETC